MIDCLARPMTGDSCRAERLTEMHREQVRQACAEDPDIWEIYYVSYAPAVFDENFDALLRRPWVPFALFSALIFWMYWTLAQKPGGQPIGALERVFAKVGKALGRIFRRRRRLLPAE